MSSEKKRSTRFSHEVRSGHEVEVDAWVLLEPVLHIGMLVGGVVVQDEVEFEVGIGLLLDSPQKTQELLMPVARQALMDHVTGDNVERREERGRAVTLVVVGHGSGPTLLERKARLCSVQRLDLALLVEREHDRPFRRGHVEPYHVTEFLDELRIGGELEVPYPVRLQAVRLPDPAPLCQRT